MEVKAKMIYKQAREKIAQEVGQHAVGYAWKDCSANEQEAAFKSADFILSKLLTPTQLEAWKKGGELAVFKRDVSPQSKAEK